MSALELLTRVSAHGVHVSVDGPELVLRGPVSTLPPGIVDQLREHKGELIVHLRRPATPPTKRVLGHLAGDAAKAIWKHCAGCSVCPEASAFGSIIAPIGCCAEGREIWKAYRKAVADFRGVN